MSAALRKHWTLQDFLAWEERQELRWEFDGCEPRAMTGGTAAHAQIQVNLAAELRSRLRGTPCRFFNSALKIQAAGSIRYPDGFVTCTAVAAQSQIAAEPVVIFEVLSASTAYVDMGIKALEYQATPSVKRYVILRQDRVAGLQYERRGELWIGQSLEAEAVLHMPEIGVDVPLAAFYEDVAFEPEVPEAP